MFAQGALGKGSRIWVQIGSVIVFTIIGHWAQKKMGFEKNGQ